MSARSSTSVRSPCSRNDRSKSRQLMRTLLRNALAAAFCAARRRRPRTGMLRSGSSAPAAGLNLSSAICGRDQSERSGGNLRPLQGDFRTRRARPAARDAADRQRSVGQRRCRAQESPPDPVPFRTALTVLSNVETWGSCDTDADVVRIAEAANSSAERECRRQRRTTAPSSGRMGSSIRCSAKEHSDAAGIDATVARLEKLLGDPAFEVSATSGWSTLRSRTSARRRRSGMSGSTRRSHRSTRLSAILRIVRRRISACVYVRDANKQLDSHPRETWSAKADAQSADHFLYNDFVLLRAMNAVLANDVEYAKN